VITVESITSSAVLAPTKPISHDRLWLLYWQFTVPRIQTKLGNRALWPFLFSGIVSLDLFMMRSVACFKRRLKTHFLKLYHFYSSFNDCVMCNALLARLRVSGVIYTQLMMMTNICWFTLTNCNLHQTCNSKYLLLTSNKQLLESAMVTECRATDN